MAHAVAKTLREAGAEIDIERFILELRCRPQGNQSQEDADVIIDVVAHWLASAQKFLRGVFIRSPHDARYTQAAILPGLAAANAEGEKRIQYGDDVLTVATEAYGRLGSAVQDGFQILASAAIASGVVSPNLATSLPTRLRIHAQQAAMLAKADVTLLALGHNIRAFCL